MSKEIQGFLLDVDGCLLSTQGEVSPYYYRALSRIARYIKMANQGLFPKIMFCSGRDRNYIEAVAFMTGLPKSLCVIESGIALFNPYTKELILNPALTPTIEQAFREISGEKIPQILERYPGLFLYPGNMINVAVERCYGSDTSIEDAYESLKKELEDLLKEGLIEMHHSDSAVDISPKGIDKASGVKFLAGYTGLDLNKVVGTGDTNGDFPMLSQVGHTSCPKNATLGCKKLVKETGGYISKLTMAAGVADILHHFTKEG